MQDILEGIGLTPTEAKVYLALLDLGETKVSEILKKAEINSGRIYDILSSLETKGLVSKVVKKGVKFYIPSPPKLIKDLLIKKKESIEKQEKDIDQILPQLMEKYAYTKEKTEVEVFLGIKGMKTAYDLLFEEAKKDKELCVLGVTNKIKYPQELLDLLTYHVYKKRRELRLKTKKILDTKTKKEGIWSKDNSNIRYLRLPALTSIEILGNKVLIQIFQKEIIAILITNKQAASDFRKQFMFLWNQASN